MLSAAEQEECGREGQDDSAYDRGQQRHDGTFMETVTLSRDLKDRADCAGTWLKHIPGRERSSSKGPESGAPGGTQHGYHTMRKHC